MKRRRVDDTEARTSHVHSEYASSSCARMTTTAAAAAAVPSCGDDDSAAASAATASASAAAACAVATADAVVVLNVGGTLVTTLASTLRACTSRFTDWLRSGFADVPRDDDGHPFIDRDATTFRHVLNYLRGYDLPSRADELLLLAEDAVYYDMTQLMTDLCIASPPQWRFSPGPGVSVDGDSYSTADILGLCGAEPLSPQQVHSIIFRMDKCELVEVGVVAAATAREDCQLHHVSPSVCYCNTGDLVKRWTEEPVYVSGAAYKAQELVSIRVQYVEQGSALLDGHVDGAPPPSQPAAAAAATTTTAAAAQPPPLLPSSLAASVSLVRASQLHSASMTRADNDNNNDEEQQQEQQQSQSRRAHVSSPRTAARGDGDEDAASAMTYTGRPLAGALVTFCRENKVEFEVLWPAPVPPLQFAVSMQGTSAVSIVDAVSVDRYYHNGGSSSNSGGGGGGGGPYVHDFAQAPLRGSAYARMLATAASGRMRSGGGGGSSSNSSGDNNNGSRATAASVQSLPLLSADTLEASALHELTPLSLGFDHIM